MKCIKCFAICYIICHVLLSYSTTYILRLKFLHLQTLKRLEKTPFALPTLLLITFVAFHLETPHSQNTESSEPSSLALPDHNQYILTVQCNYLAFSCIERQTSFTHNLNQTFGAPLQFSVIPCNKWYIICKIKVQ